MLRALCALTDRLPTCWQGLGRKTDHTLPGNQLASPRPVTLPDGSRAFHAAVFNKLLQATSV